MFKRIVKFNDGTYGVRKWTLFSGYLMLDINGSNYWWYEEKNQKEYCRGTLKQAKQALDNWNNRNGKSIKL